MIPKTSKNSKRMSEFENVTSRLKAFMENEIRSCSMDFGCVTPEYVYRMWEGSVAIEEIESGMVVLRHAQNL